MSSDAPATIARPPSIPVADLHIANALITSAQISGRIGVDIEATITYQAAKDLELAWHLASDPHGPPTVVRSLNDDDLRTLLGEIRTTLENAPPGLDTDALESFGDLVEGALDAAPGGFGKVRFGPAVEEVFGGTVTLIGHLGLGVDVAATVHDAGGVITVERHIVPRPPGPFRPLTPAERDSLTAALSAWLEANQDPAWQQILTDLER